MGWSYEFIAGYQGQQRISLADMIRNPSVSLKQVESNVRNNWIQMATNAFFIGLGTKMVKKALSYPVRQVNSQFFTGKNALFRGMGIRL